MKSIERTFKKIERTNPDWSSFICFAEAVQHTDLCEDRVGRWFNKLVWKTDYFNEDKRTLLRFLRQLKKCSKRTEI